MAKKLALQNFKKSQFVPHFDGRKNFAEPKGRDKNYKNFVEFFTFWLILQVQISISPPENQFLQREMFCLRRYFNQFCRFFFSEKLNVRETIWNKCVL